MKQYENEGVIWHQHSNKLMEYLLKLWNNKEEPILDLGCGHNFYMTVFTYLGYDCALGYDSTDLFSKRAIIADITKPLNIEGYEHILSLEVGEHIPKNIEQGYFDNLCKGKDLVLSWAHIGQAGVGHINCKKQEDVIFRIENRGMRLNKEITAEMRRAVVGCHCTWFIKNLLYFENV